MRVARPGAAAAFVLLALAAVATTAGGCWRASEQTARRAERALRAGDPRILVVPLNVAVRLSPGLEAAVEPVQQALLDQLGQQGARVSFLAVEDAHALWQDTMTAMRSMDRNTASLEQATGTFVRALRDVVDLDFVLMPALGYREARVERGYASWDGVTRSLTARRQSWLATDRVPAYSLHVQVYTPDGRLWRQRWGGIDVVPQDDPEDPPALSPEQVEKTAEFIQRGVAIALNRED